MIERTRTRTTTTTTTGALSAIYTQINYIIGPYNHYYDYNEIIVVSMKYLHRSSSIMIVTLLIAYASPLAVQQPHQAAKSVCSLFIMPRYPHHLCCRRLRCSRLRCSHHLSYRIRRCHCIFRCLPSSVRQEEEKVPSHEVIS